jgi:sugar O-acyltransferase (sialic acid O-acetyltransferase NeuD family)
MTSSDRALVILGAGGHAAVVAEAATRAGWRIVGVAASDKPAASGPFAGAEWFGDPDGADTRARVAAQVARGAMLHAAVGDAAVRERWFTGFGGADAFAAVIDPTAVVSPSARIGRGVFLSTHSVVHARAEIGVGVIVNTSAVVEHDSVVGDFAHLSPGAILCGAVRIGSAAQVGAGAVVIPNRVIGAGATVGDWG